MQTGGGDRKEMRGGDRKEEVVKLGEGCKRGDKR